MPNQTALAEMIDESGQIDVFSIVQVSNNGTEDFNLDYGNKRYVIKAGTSRSVPYHGMVLYCGDPRAFDVPGDVKRRFRTDEFKRLRVLYGVYDDFTEWENRIPKLTVTSLTGEPIVTVLDDPEGDASNIVEPGDTNEELVRQLAVMQNQMNELMARINENESTPTVTVGADNVGVDMDDDIKQGPGSMPTKGKAI